MHSKHSSEPSRFPSYGPARQVNRESLILLPWGHRGLYAYPE